MPTERYIIEENASPEIVIRQKKPNFLARIHESLESLSWRLIKGYQYDDFFEPTSKDFSNAVRRRIAESHRELQIRIPFLEKTEGISLQTIDGVIIKDFMLALITGGKLPKWLQDEDQNLMSHANLWAINHLNQATQEQFDQSVLNTYLAIAGNAARLCVIASHGVVYSNWEPMEIPPIANYLIALEKIRTEDLNNEIY